MREPVYSEVSSVSSTTILVFLSDGSGKMTINKKAVRLIRNSLYYTRLYYQL